MIDVADSSAVYYYHYDGLGSVVALSNSSGNSCQSYEYSAFGRVWAEYPEFRANPYMFTGRRFDYETGLYYYRARYYNPYIGRFLQTDPIGYSNGINWYAYCGNNPIGRTDPSGLAYKFYNSHGILHFGDFDSNGELTSVLWVGGSLEDWYVWAENENVLFDSQWMSKQAGFELWKNSPQEGVGLDERLFWEIQALEYTGIWYESHIRDLGSYGVKIVLTEEDDNRYQPDNHLNTVYWDPYTDDLGEGTDWSPLPPLAVLTHELSHAWVRNTHLMRNGILDIRTYLRTYNANEKAAVARENRARNLFYDNMPGYENQYPRPWTRKESFDVPAWEAWNYYFPDLPGYGIYWWP